MDCTADARAICAHVGIIESEISRRLCRASEVLQRAASERTALAHEAPTGDSKRPLDCVPIVDVGTVSAVHSGSHMPPRLASTRRHAASRVPIPLLCASRLLLSSLRLGSVGESVESLADRVARRSFEVAQREAECAEQQRLIDEQHAEVAQHDRLCRNIQALLSDRRDELLARIECECARLSAAERSFDERAAQLQSSLRAQQLALDAQQEELRRHDIGGIVATKEAPVGLNSACSRLCAVHSPPAALTERLCSHMLRVQARQQLCTAFVRWRHLIHSVPHIHHRAHPMPRTLLIDAPASAAALSSVAIFASECASATRRAVVEVELREPATDTVKNASHSSTRQHSCYQHVQLTRLTPAQRRLVDKVQHQSSSSSDDD